MPKTNQKKCGLECGGVKKNNVFYAGVEVAIDHGKCRGLIQHVTLMYSDITKTVKRIFTKPKYTSSPRIKAVEYWEGSNVTVAVFDCPELNERFDYYSGLGFCYGYDFNPHVTLAYGEDLREYYSDLVGCSISIFREYTSVIAA